MPSIYFFTDGCEDRNLLGNKGANLVTMTRMGLPVPPGFVVSIEAFKEFQRSGKLPANDVDKGLKELERQAGKRLGRDLAVSVRSSAPASMPGMMDTILDIRGRDEILTAIEQVFGSWNNARAMEYRRLHNISKDTGTAAIVQAMVFGDRDDRSGTGVMFTRNPSTGQKELFGEYMEQAKGEDLVSGRRTPKPISSLKGKMADLYSEVEKLASDLENHFHEMQDVEFTIESGRLYSLQTRTGKRSGQAAVRIAVDMAKEGLISREDAIMRVSAEDIRSFLHRRIENPEKYTPIARGLAAAPGATGGKVVFQPFDAVAAMQKNERVLLVREETSPDDIQGIAASTGVLTSRGGLTSHAAIVTRAMGKPCICGAEDVKIDLEAEQFVAGGETVRKGDIITIDGKTGHVYLGELPLVETEGSAELDELLTWADQFRKLRVKANADTADMIAIARKFGAEGIGLCRTERHFNAPDRLAAIRAFILAESEEKKAEALDVLRRLQKQDFVDIFRELQGMPIIVRLLDLPLHEFLPPEKEAVDPLVRSRIQELKETNPMLGHRGVRLAVTSPEIYQMQIEAISEALAGVPAEASIMVPQVITLQELLWVKKMAQGRNLRVGVMMETVRACMRAGKLAEVADFFSFGTNDLTQAVFSFSREDAEKKFLSTYLQAGILRDNPFMVVDVKGVGRLMETAVTWARKAKPDLDIGVCGEHAGEPRSIVFFHSVGVNSVSCSPFRIPIAKLAAAKAGILESRMSAAEKQLEALVSGA